MERNALFSSLIAKVVYERLFVVPGFSCAFGESSGVKLEKAAAIHPSGAERRHLIARCRSLRNDIRKFEEEFERHSGRKPHSSDRAHMMATYSEYRKLKTIVRDNAATHIQAVFRGYNVRFANGNKPHKRVTGDTASHSVQPRIVVGFADKLSQLKAEKSSLKARLRSYDVKFASEHGKNPSKSDKEHLRPQYQRYHDLKAMIATLEGAITSSTSAPTDGKSRASRGSSDAGDDEDDSDFRHAARFNNPHETLVNAGFEDDLGTDETTGSTSTRGESRTSDTVETDRAGAAPQGLKDLRLEKRKLQQFLRTYEKDFEDREGRKVKFVKDIAPVIAEYTKYKHIKAILKELHQGSIPQASK